MNRLPTLLSLALVAALLGACGTSPPVRYYSLEPAVVAGSGDGPGARILGFGPLRMPDYLKRSQIVTRGAGAEMEVHELARWVEPVDKAMHRMVAANLDAQLEGVVVVGYPYFESLRIEYVVLGQVERFDSDATGQVVLEVQWALLSDQRKALIAPQRARYEARAADPGDPDAIARAMNAALERFSDDIATQLRSLLAEDQPSD